MVAPLNLAAAHEMTYAPPDRKDDITTSAGVISFRLINRFDRSARFVFDVLDAEREKIPPDHWRTNGENDVFELAPGALAIVHLQVRYPGKYLACSRLVDGGLATRICATLNKPF